MEELIQNLIEKGKGKNIRKYWKYIILRRYGMPPHGGLGAAPERIIYGLLNLDHIRLTKPWPRYPDRRISEPDSEPLNPWGDPELQRVIKKYDIK
jgi:aspartyl/asparaginyl-tRNA synthetase